MGEQGPTLVLLFELDWYNYETVETDRGLGKEVQGGRHMGEGEAKAERDRKRREGWEKEREDARQSPALLFQHDR